MMDMLGDIQGPPRQEAKRIILNHRDVSSARERVARCRLEGASPDALIAACVDEAVDEVYQCRTACPGSLAGWQVFVSRDCLRAFQRHLRDQMCLRVRRNLVLRMAERSLLWELVAEHGFVL